MIEINPADELLAAPKEDKDGIAQLMREDRTDAVTKTLVEMGVAKSAITVFKPPHETVQDLPEPPPYNIVEVHDESHHAQIAVRDLYGYSTYVIRQPKAIDPLNPKKIDTAVLKQDPTVWKFSMVHYDQWSKSLERLVKTPIEDLQEQLKSRISWEDKKQELCLSLIAHLKATGHLPKSNDDSVIEYGPLAGQTTLSRGGRALSRGTIVGLEGINGYYKLFEALCEHMPKLKDHLNKSFIPASLIFNEASHFADTEALIPQADLYEDTQLVGTYTLGQLRHNFALEAVSGLEEYINDNNPNPPRSPEEFYERSGLAVRRGGLLERKEETLALAG